MPAVNTTINTTATTPMPASPAVADAASAATQRQRVRFFTLLQDSLADGSFARLVLAKPRPGTAAEDGAAVAPAACEVPQPLPDRMLVRRITLRGADSLSFVHRHATRDLTRNLPLPAGVAQVQALLGPAFLHAHLWTAGTQAHLAVNRKGTWTLNVTAVARRVDGTADADAVDASARDGDGDGDGEVDVDVDGPPPATHDREKKRWIAIDRPFLAALGVTTAQHQLVPAMARKWKQINKFVEVFAHALARSTLAGAQRISVVDFGSGKGYLTFAVHDWLCHVQGLQAHVTGVELRPDMVALCNAAIARLGLAGLHIQQGDVRSHQPSAIDVMIALHACDEATDHAIHLGLRAGAQVILCSPCCHKQLRPQLLSPHPLRPILQHGIHSALQAEMLTDSLRALLLDACGYDTQVFEFVSLEHTSKNKMILAVRRPAPASDAATRAQQAAQADAFARADALKAFFGIRAQRLDSLLRP